VVSNAGQDIREISFRIEAVQLGRFDDGIRYPAPWIEEQPPVHPWRRRLIRAIIYRIIRPYYRLGQLHKQAQSFSYRPMQSYKVTP
jgi:hypothetical protein